MNALSTYKKLIEKKNIASGLPYTYPSEQLNSIVEPKRKSVLTSTLPLGKSPRFLHCFSRRKMKIMTDYNY